VPRTQDLVHVRALLERDRPWAVYALGDLSPPFCHDSEWIVTEEPSPGLALLYRGFGTPVLFLHGDTEALAALLVEIHEPRMYLSIREAALPLVEARWRVSEAQLMARMLLDWSCFRPPPMPGVVRLEPEDLPRLERLYADGVPTGEAPDFFQPSLLEGGVYFGAPEDGGELAAAAGTHLVAP